LLREQLHSELSLSSPSRTRLKTWRAFFETAWALLDLLDADLQEQVGFPLRWYDVFIALEESPGERLRMNELALKILSSKSGLTRVVDRMEEAGYVVRERPAGDRRVIEVALTEAGREAMLRARRFHRHAIQQLFARHLDDADFAALEQVFPKVRDSVRALRAERLA
jgi:DNA-binding MarR family transcriptional regulator